MKQLTKANTILKEFASIANTGTISNHKQHGLRVGIDLGTSSIVLAVVNRYGKPIYGAFEYNQSIKDGLVVDYIGAVTITGRLKEQAETVLGKELTCAAAAIPPGTVGNNRSVVGHVLESAGFEVTHILDEPTAAANVLHMQDGVVIDVGGGTTGISIFKDGDVIYTVDEPTGGTHMGLVLCGAYGISMEEAEAFKRDKSRDGEIFSVIRPVAEKMASISKRALADGGYEVGTPIYVVGGATNFKEFEGVFTKYLGNPVYKPVFPEFVTPIGIAMGSERV